MKQGQITSAFHQTKKAQPGNNFGTAAALDSKLLSQQSAAPQKLYQLDPIQKAKNLNPSTSKVGSLKKDQDQQHSTYSSSSSYQERAEENQSSRGKSVQKGKSRQRKQSKKNDDCSNQDDQEAQPAKKSRRGSQKRKMADKTPVPSFTEVAISQQENSSALSQAMAVSLQEASTCASTKKRNEREMMNQVVSPSQSSPISEDYDHFTISQESQPLEMQPQSQKFIMQPYFKKADVEMVEESMNPPTNSKKRKLQEISNSGVTPPETYNTLNLEDLQLEDLQSDSKRKQFNKHTLEANGLSSSKSPRRGRSFANQKLNPSVLAVTNSLSSSTLAILKRALNPQQNAKSQLQAAEAAVSSYKPHNEAHKKSTPMAQDLTFEEVEKLSQNSRLPQFYHNEKASQQTTSTSQLSQLSAQAQGIVSSVMKQKAESARPQQQPHQVFSQGRTYNELSRDDVSMRLKHSQLIQVKRELVLPHHYKDLLDMFIALDTSLSFMRKCRNGIGKFEELQKSMEQCYHKKRFEISHFRQMMTIAPDFFSYKYEKHNAYSTPVLSIDFKKQDDQTLSQAFLDERHKIFRERLYEYCRDNYYSKFVESTKSKQADCSQLEPLDSLSFDPLKEKMWHHKFDPHSVEQIPLFDIVSELNRLNQHKPETIKDFLNKSNIQSSLVQKALQSTTALQCNQEEQKQNSSSNLKPSAVTATDDKEEQRWVELSKKTGISVATLKIIKSKEQAVKQAQTIMNKTISDQDSQKRIQQLTKTCDQILLQMNFKNVSAMYLHILIQSLNNSTRGIFISQESIGKLIEEIAEILPEWLCIKDVKGKLVKINKKIASHQLQSWIRERVLEGKSQEEKMA